MSDILIVIGALFFLIFVTFLTSFICFLASEHRIPENGDDYLAIFFYAWAIAIIINTITLCSCLSMQKELNKYENQVKLEEKSDEHKL